MNDFLLSILLGIVEGLTEFLPVSSTAHLRIVEALLHLDLHDAYWKMYTIVIQLGAILALPVYFWNRILKFLSTFPRGESGNRNVFTHPLGLTIIAFVITAIPSFFLKKQIGQNLENLWVMAWALFIGVVTPGSLDRFRTDCVGSFSWNIAFDVNYRSRSVGGAEPECGARVFVFPFHADHGGRDRLRFAQDGAAWQR